MSLTNQEWLELNVKIATPNEQLPIIQTKMGICYCGEPCVCQIEEGQETHYMHAITMQEECAADARNDPPT